MNMLLKQCNVRSAVCKVSTIILPTVLQEALMRSLKLWQVSSPDVPFTLDQLTACVSGGGASVGLLQLLNLLTSTLTRVASGLSSGCYSRAVRASILTVRVYQNYGAAIRSI